MADIWSASDASAPLVWSPGKDTRPTDLTPTILEGGGRPRRVGLMRWGWDRDFAATGRLLHARCEDIQAKRTFSEAIQLRRCLIPADAWFDVVALDPAKPKSKSTYRIQPTSDQPFALAGIWERGTDGVGHAVIVMTAAHESIKSLERMPVLVQPEQAAAWLSGSTNEALALARPVEAEAEPVA